MVYNLEVRGQQKAATDLVVRQSDGVSYLFAYFSEVYNMVRALAVSVAMFVVVPALVAEEPKKPVGAIRPHPLDAVFDKATTEKEASDGLGADPQFKKAIEAAMKAKKEAAEAFKKNPRLAAPSPASAARKKFLEVLLAEDK